MVLFAISDLECNETLSAYTGEIVSIRDGNFVPDNSDCYWRITVNKNKHVALTNIIFLPEYGSCSRSYFEVYDNGGKFGKYVVLHCTLYQTLVTHKIIHNIQK
jgi:hypothetical protein